MTASEREEIRASIAEASRRLYGAEYARPAFKRDRRADVGASLKSRQVAPLVFTLGVRIAERPEE